MDWKKLNDSSQLEEIEKASTSQAIMIFKHSTRCSISSMALNRLESKWNLPIDAYYLDLIAFRDISNQIANKFGVEHQSPQVLVIKDGKCVYNASHMSISVDAIAQAINA